MRNFDVMVATLFGAHYGYSTGSIISGVLIGLVAAGILIAMDRALA